MMMLARLTGDITADALQ